MSACGVRLSADERTVLAVLEDWWPGRPVWTGYLTARTGVQNIRRVVDRLCVLGLADVGQLGFVAITGLGRIVAREARDPSNAQHQSHT